MSFSSRVCQFPCCSSAMSSAPCSSVACLYRLMSTRFAHKFSYVYRKTGRTANTCILPRQSWRYDVAIKKNFQRMIGKRFGYEMGLEDRILLSSLGQRERRLDQKKINQLSAILEAKIAEAASANEEVSSYAVQFTKVQVNSSFTNVKIWWLCDGVNDTKIEECLERHRHSLRKALADSVGVNCPELHFLPDRSKLLEEEMDRLFRIADYGMDYRAVSHTGRVLGGAETGKSKRSLKKIIDSENSDKT
ncbi:hypothetical protein OSTOST_05614 [Ostertagia ostertagi]